MFISPGNDKRISLKGKSPEQIAELTRMVKKQREEIKKATKQIIDKINHILNHGN